MTTNRSLALLYASHRRHEGAATAIYEVRPSGQLVEDKYHRGYGWHVQRARIVRSTPIPQREIAAFRHLQEDAAELLLETDGVRLLEIHGQPGLEAEVERLKLDALLRCLRDGRGDMSRTRVSGLTAVYSQFRRGAEPRWTRPKPREPTRDRSRYFYGGPAGLGNGDLIETSDLVIPYRERVPVTTNWVLAMRMASAQPFRLGGAIYEVSPQRWATGEDPHHPGLVRTCAGPAEIQEVSPIPAEDLAAHERLGSDAIDQVLQREGDALLEEHLNGIDTDVRRQILTVQATLDLLAEGRDDMDDSTARATVELYDSMLSGLRTSPPPRSPARSQRMVNALIATVLPRATGAWSPLHGISHWRATAVAGERLCRHSGADSEVVRAFAVLHDSRRTNDGDDPLHGEAAADLAGELNGVAYRLGARRLSLLQAACAGHAHEETSSDRTIGTCWDADRLQLWRVHTRPDPKLLSTDAARSLIDWAAAQHGGMLGI